MLLKTFELIHCFRFYYFKLFNIFDCVYFCFNVSQLRTKQTLKKKQLMVKEK